MIKTQNTFISFLANNISVAINSHHCYQIILSLSDSFSCKIDGISPITTKGIIINQYSKHTCNTTETSVLIYYVEPDSLPGRLLKILLKDQSFIELEELFSHHHHHNAVISKQIESFTLNSLTAEELLYNILPDFDLKQKSDFRIDKVKAYIEENIYRTISLKELASIACLSSDRFRHLFKEQTGSSLSRYILWKRISNVIIEVAVSKKMMSKTITHYGFTDQSHFSKIFKRTFGIPAKAMLKPNSNIHVLV